MMTATVREPSVSLNDVSLTPGASEDPNSFTATRRYARHPNKPEIMTEGWLLKLGVVTIPGMEWKKRWFTLYSDCTLTWSRRKRRKIRGAIDLRCAELPDERLFNSSFDLAITFVIATTTRVYFLKEPDPALHSPNKIHWVQAISTLLASRLWRQMSENSIRLTTILDNSAPMIPGSFSTHFRHRECLDALSATVNVLQRELADMRSENWVKINKLVRARFCTNLGNILGDCLFQPDPQRPPATGFFKPKQPGKTIWDLFVTAKNQQKMGSSYDADFAAAINWIEGDYRSFGQPSVMFRSVVCYALNERKLSAWLQVLFTSPKIASFYPNPDAFFNSPSARRALFDILHGISFVHFQLDCGFEFHKTVIASRPPSSR